MVTIYLHLLSTTNALLFSVNKSPTFITVIYSWSLLLQNRENHKKRNVEQQEIEISTFFSDVRKKRWIQILAAQIVELIMDYPHFFFAPCHPLPIPSLSVEINLRLIPVSTSWISVTKPPSSRHSFMQMSASSPSWKLCAENLSISLLHTVDHSSVSTSPPHR